MAYVSGIVSRDEMKKLQQTKPKQNEGLKL